jgi:hypothetical protein
LELILYKLIELISNMANFIYKSSEMKVDSNRTALVPVREDIVAYFTIETVEEEFYPINRAGYTPKRYNGLSDTTGDNGSAVASNIVNIPTIKGKGLVARNIKVPTLLKTGKDKIRYATIGLPNGATMLAVSEWIRDKFAAGAKKPKYFLSPSGARVGVVTTAVAAADINPGTEKANPASGGATT